MQIQQEIEIIVALYPHMKRFDQLMYLRGIQGAAAAQIKSSRAAGVTPIGSALINRHLQIVDRPMEKIASSSI